MAVPAVKLYRFFFPFDPNSYPPTTTTTSPLCPSGTTADGAHGTCPTPENNTLPPVSHSDEEAGPWTTDAERIGYSYVMPLVCMLGVVLNALTVLVLTRPRGFRAPTYTYLVALSLADFCTCLITLPIGAVRCGPCTEDELGYGRLVYEVYVWVPLSNTSEHVSAWMTVVLASDRMLTLKQPLDERALPRFRKRAYMVILGVVASAVVMNLPFFFAMEIEQTGNEYEVYWSAFGESQGFVVFTWARAVLVHFVPLTLLVFVNAYLVHQVRRSRSRCRRLSVHSRSAVRERAQARLTLMLVGTIVMFIFGHISIAFGYTVIFQAVFGEDKASTPFYANWRVATHLIAMLSYSLDFIVYCLINRVFREATVNLLVCVPKGNGRKVGDSSTLQGGGGVTGRTKGSSPNGTKGEEAGRKESVQSWATKSTSVFTKSGSVGRF